MLPAGGIFAGVNLKEVFPGQSLTDLKGLACLLLAVNMERKSPPMTKERQHRAVKSLGCPERWGWKQDDSGKELSGLWEVQTNSLVKSLTEREDGN